jgi:hypothetical protein
MLVLKKSFILRYDLTFVICCVQLKILRSKYQNQNVNYLTNLDGIKKAVRVEVGFPRKKMLLIKQI